MKLVILACLAAVALARPQTGNPDHIDILRDERVDNGDGTFNFLFETENGIYKEVNGRNAANGGTAMDGSFRFPLDDGSIVEVTFTADENGYVPQSPYLPTPHPLPAHVIETLALVDQLVKQGATWDDQGRRLTRRK
ncbi:cuticle protein AM1274-like [Eriocheir sinensis]|uniref:cuticle protein AM1274-like n=1 Tax=Eriocheir sinensis TaxID=95602 RepID=UPI0021C9B749|nr:cuticle protein AM1274-like [Eriocheir sinensis]